MIKKIYDSILKINKEYLLLFVVVAVLGLMIYSSTVTCQTSQDITITTFYPAPFGEFNVVRAKKFKDFDDPTNRFVDPSGRTQLESLRVTGGIITEYVSGPGGIFTFNLGGNNAANPQGGDATLHDVYATRFYQADPGPYGINAQRAGGKYIYDIAEGVFAKDDCEAGDVVLISDDDKADVMKSSGSFDTRVAGVVSEEPKIYMGQGESKVPLALAGVVRCKATAENGSIKRGDLLVTSSLPGHAMKAGPRQIKPGMLIGKAMQPLIENTGKIYILVNKK
ncbi:MAG: hypothetical protein L6416_07710 [Candidatus Omnitrophica bacterium]|nr:hypothetical protein [Candidatus Omnitrophota bacterium]